MNQTQVFLKSVVFSGLLVLLSSSASFAESITSSFGILADDYVLEKGNCHPEGLFNYGFDYKVCRVPTQLGAFIYGDEPYYTTDSKVYSEGKSDTAYGYCTDAHARTYIAAQDPCKK